MLNTASAFISFHGKLEDQIESFYHALAKEERFSKLKDIFLSLAKENKKHREMILRSYREVITDALEAAFPHFTLKEKDYKINTETPKELGLQDVVNKAIEIEKKSQKYCIDAGESTNGLMADVPETFEWVARRKTRRIKMLESL